MDFSSAFNTVIPFTLILKLHKLAVAAPLCFWTRNLLTHRGEVVKIGERTWSTLILNTGTLQGCALSRATFVLFRHDCSAAYATIMVVKFADDMPTVDLILDNDKTHNREEIQHLIQWCSDTNLVLNTSKNK